MRNYQILLKLLGLASTLLLLGACNGKPVDTFTATSIVNQLESNEALLYTNRAATKKELPSFNLIYEGDLESLLANEGTIDKLIKEYQLEITHSFDVDQSSRLITLQAIVPLAAPIEVGKILSLGNQVLMVEVNNLEKNTTTQELL